MRFPVLRIIKAASPILAVFFLQSLRAQTTVVGAIAGAANVSPTGAFTYNIPLALPPGVSNMMPQLAITYNSQQPASIMGVGWNISGLSSITRAVTTIHHNAAVDPVDFDGNDAYVLDGQRLIRTGPASGGQTPYTAYIKDFRQITAYGQAGDGPEWFKVETQDGVVFEYGSTPDSRMEASGRSDVLIWALAKVYDKCGNYIEFHYYDDNYWGEYRIAYIDYTGNWNAQTGPQTRVWFDYEYKPDKNVTWVHGSRIQDVWRVSQILVRDLASNSVIHKYEFGYSQDFYTHLTSIKETGQDGAVLPVTQISWQSASAQQSITNHSPLTSGAYEYSIGDFNGDGLMDMIRIPSYIYGGSNFEFYKSNVNGSFSYVSSTPFPVPGTWDIKRNPAGFNQNGRMVFDYNGDGKDDYLIIATDATQSSFQVYVFLSNGTSFSMLNNAPVFIYMSAHNGLTSQMKCIPGDYDGDGKKELFVAVPEYASSILTGYKCYLIGDEYPAYPAILAYVAFMPGESLYMSAADFDGDGRDEVHRTVNGTPAFSVLKLNIAYDPVNRKPYLPGPISFTPVLMSGYPTQWHRIYSGDFNGDGKKDVLTWTNYGGGRWEIGYAKGNNYEVTQLGGLQQTIDPDLSVEDYNYAVADFNGDGKDDILEVLGYNINTSSWPYKVWYSQGNTFIAEQGSVTTNDVGVWSQGSLLPTDMNGDGQADLLMKTQNWEPLRSMFFHKNDQRHLVASIDNGSGYSIGVIYKTLPQYSEYTPAGVAPPAPFTTTTLPLKIVTTLYDNRQGLSNTYAYAGLYLHRCGLGLRGFERVTIRDWVGDKSEVDSFYTIQYQPVLPRSARHYGAAGNQNTVISESANSYTQYALPVNTAESVYIVAPDAVTGRDNRSGTSSRTQFVYYNGGQQSLFVHGKPDEIVQNTSNGQQITTIKNEYNSGDAYYYNRAKPKKITTMVQRAGKPAYARIAECQYNSQSLVSVINTDPGTTNQRTKYITYNYFGQPAFDYIMAYGIQMLPYTIYQYSTDGRFLNSVQNALGHQEQYTYNKWGSLLTRQNINGLTTTYEYDGFNRLKRMITPSAIYTYACETASGQPDQPFHHTAWYVQTSQVNGINNPERTFYDHYGRPIRKTYKGFAGQNIYEDIAYENNGHVAWLTAPYQSGSTGITTSFAYDALDRETSRSVSGGNQFLTQYNLLSGMGYNTGMQVTTTNTATGLSRTTETDGTGKTVKVTDNNNSLVYSYNSNGQPDQIGINYLAVMPTYFTYDAFGNCTSMQSQNTGTISYQYDALGRMTRQTDGNGKAYQFGYDILNRLTMKSGPDGNYTYQYDNGTGLEARGKLISMQSPYGTQKFYGYDTYSRLSRVEDRIGALSFVSQYTYDGYNRPVRTTYPTGDQVENIYNSNGYLWYIRMPSPGQPAGSERIVYRVTDQDAMGNVTSAGYGPDMFAGGNYIPTVSVSEPHNAHGFMTASDVYSNSKGSYLSRFSYSFNTSTGNLSWRKDVLRNRQENFSYDILDRLTGISGNASSQQTISYSMEGNINGKSDMAPIPVPGPTSQPGIGYNRYAIVSIPNPYVPTIPSATQEVSYMPFNKVKEIKESNNRVVFTYGPDEQRIRAQYYLPGNYLDKTRYYSNDYEQTQIDNIAKIEVCYIRYGSRIVGWLERWNGSGPQLYYVHTDHLGSLTHVMDGGELEYEQSFDAWGRMRDPGTWTPYTNSAGIMYYMERGYTGHEHIIGYGIINMNGRLYDPVMGRMFSPDPYVVDVTSLQAYNRYSYALNNPLKYTDPSGEIVWAPILIGAAVGGLMNYISQDMKGNINGGWDVAKAWSIGALSGAATGYLGGFAPLGTSWLGSTAYGAILGGVSGGATTYANTGDWDITTKSMLWGGIGGAIGGFITSEEFGNLMKGQGFKDNEKVFSSFVKDGKYQEALDYFGINGTYTTDKTILQGNPAVTNTQTGDMYFGDYVFSKNFDQFKLIADHEIKHRLGVLNAIKERRINTKLYFEETDPIRYYHNLEEWNVHKYNYFRQGLYPKHGVDIVNHINGYGVQIGKESFNPQWWHFIYKIPRRW